MERNSVIVERLENSMGDRLPRTAKYQHLLDEARRLEQELLKDIQGNDELIKKYLAIESVTNESQLEYQSMCFCEGVRLGFKLCMDIFEV